MVGSFATVFLFLSHLSSKMRLLCTGVAWNLHGHEALQAIRAVLELKRRLDLLPPIEREADIAQFRLTGAWLFIEKAFQKAPNTAEVLLYWSACLSSIEKKELLERLFSSPIVFATVRRGAKKRLDEQN